MKNYELLERLTKYPAGASVDFNKCLSDDEIDTVEVNENCVVVEIDNVDYDEQENQIMLS